jgi:hypothetical protein
MAEFRERNIRSVYIVNTAFLFVRVNLSSDPQVCPVFVCPYMFSFPIAIIAPGQLLIYLFHKFGYNFKLLF